jgi:2-desacetyl-2-hydroxyethyl bacteriochlorophyllide A dehydrogenase
MKALVVEKPGVFSIQEVPYPEPGPGEVTIRNKACCVCGTDVHLIKGEFGGAEYPLIPGHEFAGTIDKVGPGITSLTVGDVASIEPFIACGYCYYCRKGDYNVCLNGAIIGHSASRKNIKLHGGFAEYVTVPVKNVYTFQKASFHEASFLPNLNTAVYALRKARLQPGDSILIIGAGTMGLLYVQLAKASGSPLVAITDRAENRLDLAKRLGADSVVLADKDQESNLKKLTPHGFDVVIECVGHGKLLEQCFHSVRDRGRIIIFGLAPKDHISNVRPFDIAKRNLEIIGSVSAAFCGQATRDLIDTGVVKIRPLISHTFALADFRQALEKAQRPEECIRVVVEP